MDIHYYTDSRGRQPVYEWYQHIKKHDKVTWRKFYQLQVMLKENGKEIQAGEIIRKDIKKLKKTDDIWQLRIDDNRLLFFYFSSDTIIFTNQFQKKQDNTPKNEIKRAERRKVDWIKNHKM